MNMNFISTRDDMQWLADVHLGGELFGSAVLFGNEDCPYRIECYYTIAPRYDQLPDARYTLQDDGTYRDEYPSAAAQA